MIPSGYKTSKLYSVLPDDGSGDFTVVSDSKYVVGSTGTLELVPANTAAFDYSDGSGCPSLLVEPERTNYYSDNTTYSFISGTATDTINSSESTLAGATIVEINGLTGEYTDFKSTFPIGTVFVSILIKSNVSEVKILLLDDYYSFIIDIEAHTFVSGNPVGNLQFKDLNNGYTRVSFSVTNTNAGTKVFRIILTDDSQTIYLGAVNTELNEATSYIKTTGTSVTKAADVISVTTPAEVTSITETIGGVEQTPITVIPTTYQIPNGLINKIIME